MNRLDKKTIDIIKKAISDDIKFRHYREDVKKGLELAIKIIDWENEGGNNE